MELLFLGPKDDFLIVIIFPAGSWLLHGGVRGVRTKEETH
jgi:hypothetical protein